jgi:UDP-4-amino-4-deoxy-L-arabinose formyltransferase/UDP-glucuronic acid dehydrogenase (UDP-4-keto-hexauronic acid decarboxylating)
MARTLRVLLACEEAAGAQALRLVHESGRQVVGVLTGRAAGAAGAAGADVAAGTASAASAQGPAASGPVAALAARLGLRTWPARRVREPAFARELACEGVDLLLNVHSLFVVAPELLALPRLGCFNVHPGPLPEYAGLNAPSWAILAGEREHAVTVHWMDAGIDTGDVAYEERFPIAPAETAFTLSAKGVRAALPLLGRLLDAAEADPPAIPRRPQRKVPGQYHGREVPHGGRVDWNARAAEVERYVRAADYGLFASPWGAPRGTLSGVGTIELVRTACTGEAADALPGTIGAAGPDGVRVACGDEWLLVTKLRIDGKPAEPARLAAATAFEVC